MQNYCNNNFLVAISMIIPRVEKNGKFQSWAPVTGGESIWNSKIDKKFEDSQGLKTKTPNAESFLDSIKYELLVKYYVTLCRTTATTIFLSPSARSSPKWKIMENFTAGLPSLVTKAFWSSKIDKIFEDSQELENEELQTNTVYTHSL